MFVPFFSYFGFATKQKLPLLLLFFFIFACTDEWAELALLAVSVSIPAILFSSYDIYSSFQAIFNLSSSFMRMIIHTNKVACWFRLICVLGARLFLFIVAVLVWCVLNFECWAGKKNEYIKNQIEWMRESERVNERRRWREWNEKCNSKQKYEPNEVSTYYHHTISQNEMWKKFVVKNVRLIQVERMLLINLLDFEHFTQFQRSLRHTHTHAKKK